jgi:hypothetical protein
MTSAFFAATLAFGSLPVHAAEVRPVNSAHLGLELDGVFAGWVNSTEGGHATSDVITDPVGPDHIVHKHLGPVKYEDITLTLGVPSRAVNEWMAGVLEGGALRRHSGVIVFEDFNFGEQWRLEFQNAYLSEIGFPALDASSKDELFITLTLTPELTRELRGSGQPAHATEPAAAKLLAGAFRLDIDGLQDSCSRVLKIEALTVKQKVAMNGSQPVAAPAGLELPNLVITTDEAHATDLQTWFKNFVIVGNGHGQNLEKSGSLAYLDAHGTTQLELNFYNLGITKLTAVPATPGDSIHRVQAEMYLERISLK